MSGWVLVQSLAALRDEFDQLSPHRDHRSDGSVGDRAHQDRPSDHNPDETGETPYEDSDSRNEVHAIDVDDTGPWPYPFSVMVDEIVKRHRQGLDNRLQNVIYNGRIASRSWGWTWKTYKGSNAHTEHGHFSARYDSASESSTRPWGIVARFTPPPVAPEADVTLSNDLIKITRDTAAEIGKTEGEMVPASTLLQLAVIKSSRAEDDARDALTIVKATADKVDQVLAALTSTPPVDPPTEPTDPPADPDQGGARTAAGPGKSTAAKTSK